MFTFQSLKRKEREFEHEMERLAKEKIAAQNRILFLKRELAQWDIDVTKLLPEPMDISAVKLERSGESSPTHLMLSFINQTFISLRTIERCLREEQSCLQFHEFAFQHHCNITSMLRQFGELTHPQLNSKFMENFHLSVNEFIAEHHQRVHA